jgi:hypothetical protein
MSNWNYVAAGYAITGGTLIAYAVWLRVRLRRARD